MVRILLNRHNAVECYICNAGKNKLVSLYSEEAIKILFKWLPIAVNDGNNLEARVNVSYAANVLCGYIQSLTFVTSHHIIGQCLGGFYPKFPHGATLITIAEAYYKLVMEFIPESLNEIGGFIEEPFIDGLLKLLAVTEVKKIKMSSYDVKPEDFKKIADVVIDDIGIDFDHYKLTKIDIIKILESSYS